jgi:hypothetical protein
MTTLSQASKQWATRPAEERFTSLPGMLAMLETQRAITRAAVVSSRKLRAVPLDDNQGLIIEGPNGHGYSPTHWSFGQAAQLTGAPAGYLRALPAPLAADCLNYGFQVDRSAQDIGVLLSNNGTPELRAMTGPRYGRIWNDDVVRELMDRFGDGVTGDFKVPGTWGRPLDQVDIKNTTLYAGDRDMFVFLADETNRIELPGRRDGKTGELARGFFISNSETGAGTLRVKTFFLTMCARIGLFGELMSSKISRYVTPRARRIVLSMKWPRPFWPTVTRPPVILIKCCAAPRRRKLTRWISSWPPGSGRAWRKESNTRTSSMRAARSKPYGTP